MTDKSYIEDLYVTEDYDVDIAPVLKYWEMMPEDLKAKCNLDMAILLYVRRVQTGRPDLSFDDLFNAAFSQDNVIGDGEPLFATKHTEGDCQDKVIYCETPLEGLLEKKDELCR